MQKPDQVSFSHVQRARRKAPLARTAASSSSRQQAAPSFSSSTCTSSRRFDPHTLKMPAALPGWLLHFRQRGWGRGNKGFPRLLAPKDSFCTFWVGFHWFSYTGVYRDTYSTSMLLGLSSFPITDPQPRLDFSSHMNPSILDYYNGCMYNPIRFIHTSQGSG